MHLTLDFLTIAHGFDTANNSLTGLIPSEVESLTSFNLTTLETGEHFGPIEDYPLS